MHQTFLDVYRNIVSLGLVSFGHENANHFIIPLLGMDWCETRCYRSNVGSLVRFSIHPEYLDCPKNGDKSTAPPGKSREALTSTDSVKQTRDRRRNGATSCTRRCSKAVDLPKHIRRRTGFFQQDQEDRVCQDGGEVSDRQADPDPGVEGMRRKVGQVWNDEVFHRVEDGDKDQGFPDAQPCCEKREHDCLNEESNQAIDGHDNSHSLSSQAKATRNIEEAR